jgi:hypothetical protein
MTLARLLLSCAALVFAQGASAQRTGNAPASQPAPKEQTETPAAARPSSPAPSAPAATVEPARERALSPAMSAALAERMPRYNPPPPPREPTAEEIAAAQPKNQIIRLPQVVVEGERPPVFTDRDIHTKQGMAAMAVNRYLSELDRGVLNRYTLPLFGQSQEQRALAAYAEEERLRNMNTAADRAQAIEAAEGEDAARAFRDTANSTFIRSPYLPQPNSMKRD